ncbi:MAG: MBL fold metallo-hydrolase [Acidobacteria bacterium]|nr:MBL fold metallo-hydrolase [Acidobacteriota bacterium]
MKNLRALVCVGLALVSATLFGQQPAPGAPPAPVPAIDLSGYWTPVMHEDAFERGAGNEIADYGGFALNEAGRLWALSYDPSRVTLRHHQCEGYVAPYQMRSTGNFRISEERDSRTQRLIAVYVYGQTTEGLRTIWMDGRPHPPAWAPHTARGFSTGRFVGNALVTQTTHIKQGWVRRNGLPGSDQTTMTDFFVRNGDHLTNVTVVNDPVWLSEPQVRSNDYSRQPVDHGAWLYACDDGEQILDRKPDYVPHYLFGKQPFAREFAQKYSLPVAASLMGAASMYPELPAQLRTADANALFSPLPGRPSETSRAVNSDPRDGQVHVFPVRDNIYMLVGDGGNIVVQTGEQGAFVVDTGEGKLSEKVLAAIRSISTKPIQFIANTSFHTEHTGGNGALGDAGQDPSLPGSFFVNSAPRGVTGLFADPLSHATMMGHNNVMVRMQAANAPASTVPGDTYLEERRRKFHNGDAIELFHQPNAVTDGDSLVHFRRADVIVAGDIFTTTQYPHIDVKNGGTVQGLIRALNEILNKTVFRHQGEGGTYIVPGHGYLSDEHEVVEYRDMVVIVRDRVKAMMDSGATLPQIQAARITADYDPRYGANTGPWTTAMFVEAVYNTMQTPAGTR